MSVVCIECNVNRTFAKYKVCQACREKGVELPQVETTLSMADAAARESVRQIQREQRRLDDIVYENLLPREKISFTRMVLEVASKLAVIVKEVRALDNDAREMAKTLKFDDKRELMLEFFRHCPMEHQRQMLHELMQIHNAKEDKVKAR